jgi:hypothetical protein
MRDQEKSRPTQSKKAALQIANGVRSHGTRVQEVLVRLLHVLPLDSLCLLAQALRAEPADHMSLANSQRRGDTILKTGDTPLTIVSDGDPLFIVEIDRLYNEAVFSLYCC